MTDQQKKVIKLLYQRPGEPVFMPKQGEKIVVLDVPKNYLEPRHQAIAQSLEEKWFKPEFEKISIKNVTVPDLTEICKLKREKAFLFFSKEHQVLAGKLISIFMKQKTVEDLTSVAAYCHERVNPYLFNYALSVALLHRKDTQGIELPNFFQCFPAKFLRSSLVVEAREEATVIPQTVREPIIIPQMFTANLIEPEQNIAHFREDLGINLHHWHWHLVYPTWAEDRNLVLNKDRRGELFYYMHQQVLARYNIERFACGMERAKPIISLRDVIPEGYFNKLVSGIASGPWAPRFANSFLKDIVRDGVNLTLAEMELWEQRVKEAIANKLCKDANGKEISLANPEAIDVLGNLVESSLLSPNQPFYGELHNTGHVIIALCHDPDGRYLEDPSVMADSATAMRDPIFYRWHAKINDIFLLLKDTHPFYTKNELTFNNISITELKVMVNGCVDNQFNTFWQQSTVDFSIGIDFVPLGPLTLQFTHLQHDPFTYFIKAMNNSGVQKTGTVRIFMAPKCKENGVLMDFNEQRNFMIELDKFKVNLKTGANIIKRKSADSSVTISFKQTFNTLNTDNFCGCGWPDHMLIPKGNTKGMEFDLFAMISDYELDKIVQDLSGPCNDADSYCGIRDRKYPDKRTMGYPFDRKDPNISKLTEFLTPNMKVISTVVKFTDKVVVADPVTYPQPAVVPSPAP